MAEKDSKKQTDSKSSSSVNSVILKDVIEIFPTRRLAHLDKGGVKAYAASMSGKDSLFALVCEKSLVPRINLISAFSSLNSDNVVKLVANGVVKWIPDNEERYVFIYENNLGDSVFKGDGNPNCAALGIRYEKAVDTFIVSMVSALVDMRNYDVVHGNISITNIFDGDDSNLQKVMIGECLSTPASYCQPVLYAPIERSLCNPVARGVSDLADDIYGFGATIAVMLRNSSLFPDNVTDRDVIKHKIDVGSYAVLIGNDRLTGPVLELLRGTLHDDSSQRWGVEEIQAWMDGRRLSPKQNMKRNKAKRPLIFSGNKYYKSSVLAVDLFTNLTEASQIMENGSLCTWVSRSLDDRLTVERIDDAIHSSRDLGKGVGYWERLVSRVSMAMYPGFPIQYKDVSFHPYGFGSSLAEVIANNGDYSSYIDVLNQNMVMYWVNMQEDSIPDVASLTSKFDAARNYLRPNSLLYGIERVVYSMCPDSPCFSNKLNRFYVLGSDDLLRAFDVIGADKSTRPLKFFDKHIIAFLMSHEKKMIEVNVVDLCSTEEHRVIIGSLRILAEMQRKSRVKELFGVTDWLVEFVVPLYERIHDRDEREAIKIKIAKFAEIGDVRRLLDVFDSDGARNRDHNKFNNAMIEHKNLVYEKAMLQDKLVDKKTYGAGIGREWSAVVSGVIAFLVCMALLFIYLVKDESVL